MVSWPDLCAALFLAQYLLIYNPRPTIGCPPKEGGLFVDLLLWQFQLCCCLFHSVPFSHFLKFGRRAPISESNMSWLGYCSLPAKTTPGCSSCTPQPPACMSGRASNFGAFGEQQGWKILLYPESITASGVSHTLFVQAGGVPILDFPLLLMPPGAGF